MAISPLVAIARIYRPLSFGSPGFRQRIIRHRPLANPDMRATASVASMTITTGSPLAVLVVAAPPDALLVPPQRCAVEPLVHAPEAVEAARIGRVGVVDDAVLEHERAQARPVAHV